eukprot:2221467-Amphidinium_carterae.1
MKLRNVFFSQSSPTQGLKQVVNTALGSQAQITRRLRNHSRKRNKGCSPAKRRECGRNQQAWKVSCDVESLVNLGDLFACISLALLIFHEELRTLCLRS